MTPCHSDLHCASQEIGRVFTPLAWAKWCCVKFGIHDEWKKGATVFDPTCGQGAFFLALVSIARERGELVRREDLRRFSGVETCPSDKSRFLDRIKSEYGLDLPESNFVTSDFMDYPAKTTHDIAVGNPPWINFADLPLRLEGDTKSRFIEYGLVRNKGDVLLGASRIDYASLVIRKSMQDHVSAGGRGVFLVPLSLIFNESANRHFRPRAGTSDPFSIERILEFEDGIVFKTIGTRNGLICLKKGTSQKFPVAFERLGAGSKKRVSSCLSTFGDGAWMEGSFEGKEVEKVVVEPWQVPGQGMNTCGLNNILVLERLESHGSAPAPVESFRNGWGQVVKLETRYIKPLVDGTRFGRASKNMERHVLCPYHARMTTGERPFRNMSCNVKNASGDMFRSTRTS